MLMKNKEKYHDEIFKIACGGHVIAVVNGKPVNCENLDCRNCEFLNRNSCADARKTWCESEYIEPIPKLTKQDKQFLGYLVSDGNIYIARDLNKHLWLYDSRPIKDNCGWYLIESWGIEIDSHLFQFIKYEDEKPWSIADLKKLEVEE